MHTPADSSYIDLTVDDGHHTTESAMGTLTTLPSELLHMIFDFLFARHQPDKAFFVTDISEKKCSHPLDAVAASSKTLRTETNDWAIHFLLRYKGITPQRQPTGKHTDKTFNALRGRNGLLTWSNLHCIFCGKNTARFAILMNGFHCCRVCDTNEWPDKITKTNALSEYDLKEHQLLPHRFRNTSLFKKLQDKFPRGVPNIHYGTYISCGVQTTMFLRKDVEWLARQYHDNLTAHLAMRKAARQERARKREESKKEKLQAAATVGAANMGPSRALRGTAVDPYYIDEE